MKDFKKTILLLLASIFILTSAQRVQAKGQIKIYLNDQIIETDKAPIVIKQRVMVPIRVIAENMGAEVNYEPSEKLVSIQKGVISIALVIGESSIWYSDDVKAGPIMIDVPATAKNGRTLVPLRAIAELFDMDVKWDGKKNAVYINDKAISYLQDEINIDNAGEEVLKALLDLGLVTKDAYVSEVSEYEMDQDDCKDEGFWVVIRKDNPIDKNLAELLGHYFMNKKQTVLMKLDVAHDKFVPIFAVN